MNFCYRDALNEWGLSSDLIGIIDSFGAGWNGQTMKDLIDADDAEGVRWMIRWLPEELEEKKIVYGCVEFLPLSYASFKGRKNIVKIILEHTISYSSINEAIFYAITGSSLELVKFLIEYDPDISIDIDRAMTLASSLGKLDILKFLIKCGADVCAYNDLAIRWASLHRHLKVVEFLIECGADTHAQCEFSLDRLFELNREY